MKCKNCGIENIAEAIFCENCGAPLKRKSKAPLFIVLVVAGVAVLTATILLLLNISTDAYSKQIDKGYKLIDDGKYEDAVVVFGKAIKMEDIRPEAYIGKAVAMAYDPDMTEQIAKEIAKILETGYKKSGDISVIESSEKITQIMEKNGFCKEAEFIKASVDILRASPTSDSEVEFVVANSTTAVDNKLFSLADNGLYVTDLTTGEKNLLVEISGINNFATNGKKIYIVSSAKRELYEIDIETKEKKVILNDIYSDENEVEKHGDFSWYINECFDGYIYLTESYGINDSSGLPYSVEFCYYNIHTGEYEAANLDPIYYHDNFSMYKGKLYYMGYIPDIVYQSSPLYESNPDFKEERILFENVTDYRILGNILYFCQTDGNAWHDNWESLGVKVKSYNLDTKEETTLTSGYYNELKNVSFTNFGYVYGSYFMDSFDEGGSMCYNITYFDGRKYSDKGYIVSVGDNYILINEPSDDPSETYNKKYTIITNEKKSKPFILPENCSINSYNDGIVYYYDYDYVTYQRSELKSTKIEFE